MKSLDNYVLNKIKNNQKLMQISAIIPVPFIIFMRTRIEAEHFFCISAKKPDIEPNPVGFRPILLLNSTTSTITDSHKN